MADRVDPYAGYLHALRQYHGNQAVMIGEFGVPSGLGIAHVGPDGRDQGNHSEQEMGAIDADMRTTSPFIGSMQKRARATEFAVYVRHETPTAIRLEVPFGTLEAAPRMTPDEHRRPIALNRARYSVDKATHRFATAVASASAAELDEEIAPSINY